MEQYTAKMSIDNINSALRELDYIKGHDGSKENIRGRLRRVLKELANETNEVKA